MKGSVLNTMKVSYQEEFLYFGNSVPQASTEMVPNPSKQDAKHWDSHEGETDAKELPSI